MAEQEQFYAHASEHTTALEEELANSELVQVYGLYFIAVLKSLELEGEIEVNNTISQRDAEEYRDILSLGIVGDNMHSLAIAVSSEDPPTDPKIATVLIPRTDDGWPLYIGEDKQLLTDFFYTVEDKSLFPVSTSAPIPLHGVLYQYSHELPDYTGEDPLYDEFKVLMNITEDKNTMREILRDANIRIPSGHFIENSPTVNIPYEIASFLERENGLADFVVKGTTGSQGTYVKMFTQDTVTDAEQFAKELLDNGQNVLLEERILPYSLDLADEEGNIYSAESVDYNLRVLVTSDQDPQVIDAEIRFGSFGQEPINISRGAKALRPQGVIPQDLLDKAYEISRQATKATITAAELPEGTLGVIGTDVIIDKLGQPYIIEVNAGCVGGFSTLCSLDQKPLTSVKEKLIPAAGKYLEKNKTIRESTTDLEQAPFSDYDFTSLAGLYLRHGMTKKAISTLEKNLIAFPGSKDVHSILGSLYLEQGDLEISGLHSLNALKHDNTDVRAMKNLVEVLTQAEEYERAALLLDNLFKENKEIKDIKLLTIRALVEFGVTNNTEDALQIMERYRPDLVNEVEWPFAYNYIRVFTFLQSHNKGEISLESEEDMRIVIELIEDLSRDNVEFEQNEEILS